EEVRRGVVTAVAGLVVDDPEADAVLQLRHIDTIDSPADAHLDAVASNDQRPIPGSVAAFLWRQAEVDLEVIRLRANLLLQPGLDQLLPLLGIAVRQLQHPLAFQFPEFLR